MMKAVAVTGASGFLGGHLCEKIEQKGWNLLRLSKSAREGFHKVDYSDPNQLVSALKGIDVLYHLAGLINGSREELIEANLTTTKNLIEAAQKTNLKLFVFVSSAAAAMLKGDYGKLKREAEKQLQSSGIKYLIFRPTMIYGSGDTKNIATMAKVIRRSPFIPILGGGNFKIQPVFVDDVTNVLIQAAECTITNNVYNICGAEQISFRDMFELLAQKMNRKRIFISIPLKPVQKILGIYQNIFPQTRLPVKQVMELDKHEKFDISLTKRDFDFSPIPFVEGLYRMV